MRRTFIIVITLGLLISAIRTPPSKAEIPVCTAPGTQDQVAVAAGDSFVVIVWRDDRNDLSNSFDIYGQALDYRLNPLWTFSRDSALAICTATQEEGEPAVAVGPDGVAWVVWRDNDRQGCGYQLYGQALQKNGVPSCSLDGFALTNCEGLGSRHPALISVSSSSAISAFDFRPFSGFVLHRTRLNVQKITSSCGRLWGDVGSTFFDRGWDPQPDIFPTLVPDGAGGVIAGWSDNHSDPTPTTYARRIDSGGVPQWGGEVQVCTTGGTQRNPALASDGLGGVIVVWEQGPDGGRTIRAQRIDASGVRQWGDCGKVIAASGGDLRNPQIVRSTLGRSFVIWEADYRPTNADIFAQRISFLGDTLGPRIPICTADSLQTLPRAAAGPNGSCYIVWQDGRDIGIGDDADVFAQKLEASGMVFCQPNGVRVAGLPDSTGEAIRQYAPQIVSVEIGGSTTHAGAHALVVWSDTRNGNPDIYAAPLTDDCRPGVVAVEPQTIGTERFVSFPNPLSQSTEIRFALAGQSPVELKVYDMAGRLVRVLLNGQSLVAGEHIMRWDGRNAGGEMARSGVYFSELSVAGRKEARRLVLVR